MAKGKPGRPKKTVLVYGADEIPLKEIPEESTEATKVVGVDAYNKPVEIEVKATKEEGEEAKEEKSKATGIATYGIKNINRNGRAVVVCNKCTKETKSLINNMCEPCYNEWFARSTTG